MVKVAPCTVGRTVVHPIFFGLMGYYYFVIIMGLRFASSANIYACLVCFLVELFSAFFLPLFFLSFLWYFCVKVPCSLIWGLMADLLCFTSHLHFVLFFLFTQMNPRPTQRVLVLRFSVTKEPLVLYQFPGISLRVMVATQPAMCLQCLVTSLSQLERIPSLLPLNLCQTTWVLYSERICVQVFLEPFSIDCRK